jgi:hypothetical protein
MKQDEIIEMAIQANATDIAQRTSFHFYRKDLEAFAKLVAAKEREACAEICENYADYDKEIRNDYHAHLIRARGKA